MQAWPMPSCGVRPSVSLSACPSVTFVDSVKASNHIFKMFSPSGSHTTVVFLYQMSWQYSHGNLPNGSVECRCGRQKSRLWTNIWLHRMLWTLRLARYYQHGAARLWKVMTLIAGSKRRSSLMAGDDDEMFMTRSLNVMPKTNNIQLHPVINL